MKIKAFISMVFLCALIIISVMEIEPSKDGKQSDAKEEFKTQAGVDSWKPWNFGRSPFINYEQKKGGKGSGGLGPGGNGGEGVTQGGGEENEDPETSKFVNQKARITAALAAASYKDDFVENLQDVKIYLPLHHLQQIRAQMKMTVTESPYQSI